MKQGESTALYVQCLNKLLQLNTRDAMYQFVQIYLQEDFAQNIMVKASLLLSGRVLGMITCDELALDRPVLYAEAFRSLEEFTLEWDELKFRLWELEFFGGAETESEFLSYIKLHRISDIALKYLFHTSAFHKKRALLETASLLLTDGAAEFALLLLQHGCELLPQDEELPRLLSELEAVTGEQING